MAKGKSNGHTENIPAEELTTAPPVAAEPTGDEVEKTNEYLRYFFTDPELLDLSKQLARRLAEQEACERELKEITTQLKAAVTAKQGEVTALSHLVQNGYEYRTIECEVIFDCPDKGKKSIFRLDTREKVSEQKMSGEDLQGQLFRRQEIARAASAGAQ